MKLKPDGSLSDDVVAEEKEELNLEIEKDSNNGQENFDEKKGKEKVRIKIQWWISYPLLIILCCSFVFIGYKIIKIKKENERIENLPIIISSNSSIIDVGEIIDIKVENVKENTVLVSSNPDVIKIENNNIIGISEGEVTIYAIAGEKKSNILYFKCIVNLKDIQLSENNIELEIGEEKEINAVLIPDNSTNREILWKSSNEAVATVENGKIKALLDGTTIITAYNEESKIEKSCNVTVKAIEVKSVVMDETTVNIGVGQNYILIATLNPNNATYKTVNWTSSNNSVVTVNNGQIKAVGEGEAVITATSKNGVKGTCMFKVNNIAPENKIRYVTKEFNVRIGPGTDYTKLGSVTINDEIAVLKETNNWAKIRISKNGIVGYTVLKAYSTSKRYYINNVPFINQFNIGLPTGCEAVATTMAAKYSGYNVSVQTIIDNTPTDSEGKRQETRTKEIKTEVINEETGETEIVTTTQEETVWVAENPFKYFVGHPTKYVSAGSYGCYAGPIVSALNNSGIPCSNISGCSIDTLYSYIQQGKPVIVWCRSRAQDLNQGVTWQYPDGSGEYVELIGEHCAVLIGYDGDYVYLNDPANGAGVSQPRWKFESNWYKLYSQAIIIN